MKNSYVKMGAAAAAAVGIALHGTAGVARTRPNISQRAVFAPDAPRSAPTIAAFGTPAVSAAVPLPQGAVQLDSVWYDLQDMGSLGNRLVTGADGRVHAVWGDDLCELDGGAGCPPNLNLPNPHPQRAMAYAVRSAGGAWTRLGKVADPTIPGCCVTEVFGGFGALDVTGDGRAAISQHMNEDGCDLRGDFYLQNSAGAASYRAYLTPITEPSYLFPQVIGLPNGSFAVSGEIPLAGSYDEVEDFRISRLAAAGAAFVCPVGWQCGPWQTVVTPGLFRDGKPAFPALARGSDGRAGVAVGDFGGNVFLVESSDGSFAPPTLVVTNITQYTDASITASGPSSNQFRPYVNCDLAYLGTTPHVVWSELQARRIGGQIAYFDHHSRICHWDPGHGVAVVKQVQTGEADQYDNIDNGGTGPLAGFNTITVDWPQVGFSNDGQDTYVAWLRCIDAEIDPTANAGLPGLVTGIGFADIACSVSRAGGAWSVPQNLTATPQTDERFFSLADRSPNGSVRVLFQASATNQAGVALIGDRGTAPGNLLRRIAYLERPLDIASDAVHLGVGNALEISPNPARGQVRFRLIGAAGRVPQATRVTIHSLDGRRVVQFDARDGTLPDWSGAGDHGRPVASGVYWARVEEKDGAVHARRFVWIR